MGAWNVRWLVVLLTFYAGLYAMAEVILRGETSEPRHSLFIPGQPVTLHFTITGLKTEASARLLVSLRDARGQGVRDYDVALKSAATEEYRVNREGGACSVDILAPTNRLGFFQAITKLDNGITLPSIGTRPAGYLTYAIVPDPTTRGEFPVRETFFGMLGAFEPGIIGARWNMLNYETFTWSAFEPERPGEFEESVKKREEIEAAGGWSGMPKFSGRHHFAVGGKGGGYPIIQRALSWQAAVVGGAQRDTRTSDRGADARGGASLPPVLSEDGRLPG